MNFHLYPTTQREFTLIQNQELTLEKLERRREFSTTLISKTTDKSFLGTISANTFQIISSATGIGAFCILKGEINSTTGFVEVSMHKVFKLFIALFYLAPLAGGVAIIVQEQSLLFIPLAVIVSALQFLFIRFVFVGFLFRVLSKESLRRLRDVLDVNWVEISWSH